MSEGRVLVDKGCYVLWCDDSKKKYKKNLKKKLPLKKIITKKIEKKNI